MTTPAALKMIQEMTNYFTAVKNKLIKVDANTYASNVYYLSVVLGPTSVTTYDPRPTLKYNATTHEAQSIGVDLRMEDSSNAGVSVPISSDIEWQVEVDGQVTIKNNGSTPIRFYLRVTPPVVK